MVKVGAVPFGAAWHVLVEFTHAAGEVARGSPADLECSLTDGPVSSQDLGVTVAKSQVCHNSALPFGAEVEDSTLTPRLVGLATQGPCRDVVVGPGRNGERLWGRSTDLPGSASSRSTVFATDVAVETRADDAL